jgi:YVTN family beta-propeller protein
MNARKRHVISRLGFLSMSLVLVLAAGGAAVTATAPGNPGVYTFDADFDQGTLVNVNHGVADQLQLDSVATPFEFIWVAASGRGTIIKIDTRTGAILGEYWSAPNGMGRNPSRTTVDGDGNVWAGNRDEAAGGRGSVVHIGLEENGQCEDRNTNGTIETSTGLGDIKSWSNAGGADTNGGVATAEDECVIHYVRTAGTNVRTVAVDGSNNVWVGGLSNRVHELLDSNGNVVAGTQFNLGCGGYGGLVDANGVLWSASANQDLLRYVPSTHAGACLFLGYPAYFTYGLGKDSSNDVWNTQWTYNSVAKVNAAGTVVWIKPSGGSGSRGVVLTNDGNAWIANSYSNTVTRLDTNGVVLATINVGNHPTGVAVDRAGKVWVTDYYSSDAMRIDPLINSVDLTVPLGDGANPYNYSDMTGGTLIAPPNTGTWTIIHDSAISSAIWGKVTWNALLPGDSSLSVTAASSTDGVTFGPAETVTNGVDLTVADGQYLKVAVTFQRATTGESPILYDLTILANRPPAADADGPYIVDEGSTVALDGSASSDPDGDALTYDWDLNSDGTFDTPGATPTYAGVDGPFVQPVSLRVCDPYGECDTDATTITVFNVPPTADAGPDQTVYRNDTVSLGGTWTDPATSYDNPYAWTWDVDGDGIVDFSGNAIYGTTINQSTSFALEGFYTLTFAVTDKDAGHDDDTATIEVLNKPPVCANAIPNTSTIWPPDHQFERINVLGVTDPEGDTIVITIDSIFQDEPVDTNGDGSFVPDGKGVGTSTAEVRAERAGTKKVPGNGRVYHITFTANDGHGGACTNEVLVGVPHNVGQPVIDDGALYDSTTLAP